MHRRGQFGSVAAYLVRIILVYVLCTVGKQTGFSCVLCRQRPVCRADHELKRVLPIVFVCV